MKLKTPLILASLVAAFGVSSAMAQFAPIKVNGEEISVATQQTLAAAALSTMEDAHSVLMDPKKGQAFEEDARTVAIEQALMSQYARKMGYDKDPKVKKSLELLRNHTLAKTYLSDYVAKHPITPDDIAKAYDKIKADYGDREVRLRHIFVANDVVANELMADLKAGRPFAEVAMKHSIDKKSAPKGGLLDWSSPKIYEPAIQTEIAKLKPGQTTQPFKTNEGYEIIRLEGEREAKDFPKLDKETQQYLYRRLTDERLNQYALTFAPQDKAIDQMEMDAILAKRAIKEGFDKRSDFLTAYKSQEAAFLMEVAIDKALEANPITDKAIETDYAQGVSAYGKREVKLRQIIVKDPKLAQALLERVQKGEDFAKLARENSVDKATVEKGGLTDWIPEGQFVSSLRATVSDLKPGQIAKTLITTRMGHHIVKLEEARQPKGFATLDEAREQIRAKLAARRIAALIEEQKAAAKIEMEKAPATAFGPQGQPAVKGTDLKPVPNFVKPAAKP